MEERLNFLRESLERVNAWLHFIEAKNAALAAFHVALLAALSGSGLFERYSVLFCLIMIALLGATAMVLWSFKPINHTLPKPEPGNIHPNLLHYAYIASLEAGEYLSRLDTAYWHTGAPPPQQETDYAEEIVQNARITLWKQEYFTIAFYMDLITLFAVCILILRW